MDTYINFEDATFILNMRIRMIRDILRLDPAPEIFLDKTLDDLEFIDKTLGILVGKLIENQRQFGQRGEYDLVSDLEWQFSQLLVEISGGSSPFSVSRFPEIEKRIVFLKSSSATREKLLNESGLGDRQIHDEPMVSSAELSELLRKF